MATSQLQILNKILATKDISIISLNNLTKDYFADYKSEFDFIMNHYNTYRVIPDKMTFAAAFKEFDFIDVQEPDTYLLEELYKDYNRDTMAVNFNNVRKYLMADNIDAAKEIFFKAVDDLKHGSAMTCVDLVSDTSRYQRFLDRASNINNAYISTGFPELDKLIGGIDCENENMVIAARTGIGKSWTLIKMAVAAALAGKTVGFYSGEMTADKVGYRVDTILAHEMNLNLSNKNITRGYIQEDAAYKNYLDHLKLKTMGAIKVITPNDIAGPATVDALRAFIEKEHIQILFVDQYSLLEDTSHAKQSFERVANISKAIKQLQVLKQIPIVSVSQMNRTKLEEGEQDTTQIGLSDRIGQDATVVLMLDKVPEDKTDPTDKNFIMTINVVKSRDGGDNNKLKYRVDFNSGDFSFISNPKDGITDAAAIEAETIRYNSINDTNATDIFTGGDD